MASGKQGQPEVTGSQIELVNSRGSDLRQKESEFQADHEEKLSHEEEHSELEQPPHAKDTNGKDHTNELPDTPKMMELAKTYEFWRNIVNKNPHNFEPYLPFPQEEKNGEQDMGLLRGLRLSMGKGADSLLNETELNFLKTRIGEFISFTRLGSLRDEEPQEGYSMYGTQDEEGLHEMEEDLHDYDIEEIGLGERFLYGYGPTHHIEVELNEGPPGPPDPNSDEPSCEFTFEYDHTGKLVPTYSSIEEKLRLVNLHGRDGDAPKKKNKKKKKKPRSLLEGNPEIDEASCMFCQYEAFFGVKPVHMMAWYDRKIAKEEKRRQQIKEKLERVKHNALHRREMREESEDL